MNLQIAALLAQDGLTDGAIYALLALCIVLIFTVTRAADPAGRVRRPRALTMAAIQAGQRSAVVWLLVGLFVASAAIDVVRNVRRSERAPPLRWWFAGKLVYPAVLLALVYGLPLVALPMSAQIALTLALIMPLGPLLSRIV